MKERQESASADVQRIIELGRQYATKLNHKLVCTEHLLLGLLDLQNITIGALLKQCSVTSKELHEAVEFVVGCGKSPSAVPPPFEAAAQRVFILAEQEARQQHAAEVKAEHVLLGLLLEHDGLASGILESFAMTADRLRQLLRVIQRQGQQRSLYATEHITRFEMTPTLNMVSRDLTAAALSGLLDPLIGREEELDRTMQVLSRRMKNNPVLIGPAGVGKTAIVEGLAQRIVQGTVPEHLKGQRVVSLDVGLLTIGTKYRGDFEERLKKIVAEIVAAHNLIIVVDELHTLIGAGVAEGSVDAANLLKPILARGDFRCVGTTTFDDYRRTIERDKALERRFQPITVHETTLDETLIILEGLKECYERFHHVRITPGALRAAVTLSARYIQDRQLPDKAVDLIDEAAARVCVGRSIMPASIRSLRDRVLRLHDEKESAIEADSFAVALSLRREERQLRTELTCAEESWRGQHEGQGHPTVDEATIATVVAAWAGVPAVKIDLEESERMLRLEADIHQRVIGQDRAVSAVSRAVRRSRAELRDRRRPIGSFVFAGPTGVGKTELARALAATLFGDENALITFDMSEFMEAHLTARLVGAPPGYVGYDQAGQLTEVVRRRPYSVLLFDEIEKAHTRVFDLLLQVLEDGYLNDAKGRKVDFRNTIIIMTSNAGAQFTLSHGAMGFSPQDDLLAMEDRLRAQIAPALKELFRPELLNRIDDIIIFQPLNSEQIRSITDLMLLRVTRCLGEQHIGCTITDAARDEIAHQGYDQEYGARPLRRKVQHLVEDALAEQVLRGQIQPGDNIVIDIGCDQRLAIHASSLIPIGVS